jgi:hypothetical protein
MPNGPPPDPAADGRLAKLSAAPAHVEHEGVSYTIAPLDLADIAQLKRFVRAYVISEAADLRGIIREAKGPPEHFAELDAEREAALARPLRSSFADDDLCVVEMFRLMLAHSKPDITRAQTEKILREGKIKEQLLAAASDLMAQEQALKNS